MEQRKQETATAIPVTAEHARAQLLAGLPVRERRLNLAGISTAVLEGGSGPPIVLLHDPSEHATKWFLVLPELVRTHRVVAPDLPGHGASEVPADRLSTDRVLSWLRELIERTCDSRPALVGLILGGGIAERFAVEHGDLLDRLVLVDALGLAPLSPTPEFGEALEAYLSAPTVESHDRLWSYCAFDLDRVRARIGDLWEPFTAANLDRIRTPSGQAVLHDLMEAFGTSAIPFEDLARITVPTTLIWGRHDLATPVTVAEATSARLGWPLRIIEDCADDPVIEQPEAFLRALHVALGRTIAQEQQQTRAAWNKIAREYDQTNTETQQWLGSESIRRAGLKARMRFLDVAAGSGALSLPAARLGAKVLATDLSPLMLELLRERAREENLDIETRVMDGHNLELENDTFDMAGSQFGVMTFPDQPRGISELVRVVKPGGRVLVTVYGSPAEIDFLGFFVNAVHSVRPDFAPPMDPPPPEFRLADPEKLRSELIEGGLKDVQVDQITEYTEFKSPEFLWEWIIGSNPIVERILGTLKVTDDELSTIQRTLYKLWEERAGLSGVAKLAAPINIGWGTK